MYDLFLYAGCQSLPPLTDLAEDISALADPAFQQRLLTPATRTPGWFQKPEWFWSKERDLAHALQQLPGTQTISPYEQRFIALANQAPGWLGLELERALAHALLKRLKTRNAIGLMALSDYHQPARITLKQAIQRARPFLAELAEWHNIAPPATFESKEMHYLSPMCWVIFAWGEREGAPRSPSRVFIDKLDGHLWTDGEMNLLYGL